MKKIIVTVGLIAVFLITSMSTALDADAAVRVKGYYRKNGTYVKPYYRSNSDGLKYNNYSTKGNYNPYTGKRGYVRY